MRDGSPARCRIIQREYRSALLLLFSSPFEGEDVANPAKCFGALTPRMPKWRDIYAYISIALGGQKSSYFPTQPHCIYYNTFLFVAVVGFSTVYKAILVSMSTIENSSFPNGLDDGHVNLRITLCDLISRSIEQGPARIAVSAKGSTLSYGELDAACTRLAHRLRSRGVGAGDQVPVLTTRCIEMVVCFLSVLRIGACYVPIDLDSWSAKRIKTTLAIIDARTILTTGLESYPLYDVITSEEVREAVRPSAQRPVAPFQAPAIQPSDLAYIIFTSGTTSAPKGVMVPHKGLVNYVQQGGDLTPFNMNVTPSDTVLLLFSVAFDGMA